MNILQITNRIPFPLNDGGNIATFNVTRWLNHFGHQVFLASLNTKKHYLDPKKFPPIAELHTSDIDTSINPISALKHFFGKTAYNISRFKSDEFGALIERLLKENQVDVVQLEGSYCGLYLDRIKKHFAGPVVLRSHNIEHQIWERVARNAKNPAKKLFLKDMAKKIRSFELETMGKYDGIIPISKLDEAWYQENGYKGKLETITAGINPEDYASKDDPDWQAVCFLGSLEWEPNLEGLDWFLNNVWNDVKSAVPEATFHVAGKNPPENVLNRKAHGLVIHGEVPDAAEFLGRYGILVIPLNSGSGMRLKLVEAMGAGKAIVSTSIGAEGVGVTDEKEILIADKPAEFAEKLISLLQDPEKAKSLAERARVLAVEKYSYEKLVKRFESFYLALQ